MLLLSMASPPAPAGGRWPTRHDLGGARRVAVTALLPPDAARALGASALPCAVRAMLCVLHSIGFKTMRPHAVREEGVVDGRASMIASCAGHNAGANRKDDVGLADGLGACMSRYSEAMEGIGCSSLVL